MTARRRLGTLLAGLLLVVATACEPADVQRWRAERGLGPLAPAEAEAVAARLSVIEDLVREELARRARFVGTVAPVDEARLGLSWRPGCPVGAGHLRLVRVSHMDMAGEERVGELIVHEWIAERMVTVFRALWDDRFPIARMETEDRFLDPSDFDASGEYIPTPPSVDHDNNTSGFMCRRATQSSSWSMHAFGLAVDINPVQNPYLRGRTLIPLNGLMPRTPEPGKILAGSVAVRAMAGAGMVWGGDWRTLKDYMHFSPNGR